MFKLMAAVIIDIFMGSTKNVAQSSLIWTWERENLCLNDLTNFCSVVWPTLESSIQFGFATDFLECQHPAEDLFLRREAQVRVGWVVVFWSKLILRGCSAMVISTVSHWHDVDRKKLALMFIDLSKFINRCSIIKVNQVARSQNY